MVHLVTPYGAFVTRYGSDKPDAAGPLSGPRHDPDAEKVANKGKNGTGGTYVEPRANPTETSGRRAGNH